MQSPNQLAKRRMEKADDLKQARIDSMINTYICRMSAAGEITSQQRLFEPFKTKVKMSKPKE